MRRLAFIHTVANLAGKFDELARQHLSDVDVFHMLDESVLQDLMKNGTSPSIARRIVGLVGLASDAGADLIVFTCSSTSPMIDIARQTTATPVLKVDDPMARRAVTEGERIGVLCTTTSTLGPSGDLIRIHAAAEGREVTVEPVLVEGAFAALKAGDRDGHDRLVHDAAKRLAAQCDLIVLAQASMAHLMEPIAAALDIRVLSSPPLLMDALLSETRGWGAR